MRSNPPKSSMELTFLKTIYPPVSKIFENPLKIENCFKFIMKLTLRKKFRSQDQENTNQQKFFFFGHRSLIRNNTQAAVINMTKKPHVGKHAVFVMFITAVCVLFLINQQNFHDFKTKI